MQCYQFLVGEVMPSEGSIAIHANGILIDVVAEVEYRIEILYFGNSSKSIEESALVVGTTVLPKATN